jgi:ATP-dependent helicase/nuclease subunit A
MEFDAVSSQRPLEKPTQEQQRAADPAASVWVSANAGSGKTHVLVDRLTRLMLDDVKPATILCLTFTKAAAAEMSKRLFERLGYWAIADDADLRERLTVLGIKTPSDGKLKQARQLFTRALETPGGLKVQTIHAFCQNLLNLFPVEAGLAPGFDVLDDADALALREAAWRSVQASFEADPASDLAHAFLRLEPYFNADRFDNVIRELISQPTPALEALADQPDYERLRDIATQGLGIDPLKSEAGLLNELVSLDAATCGSIIAAFTDMPPHNKFHVASVFRAALQKGPAENTVRALRNLLFTGDQVERKELVSVSARGRHPHAAELLDNLCENLRRIFILHDLHVRASLSASLWLVATSVLRAYREEKRRRGRYDFSDLISRTANMLSQARAAQWVLYKLDGGIEHILVDEAQDTNPLQWQIIAALTDEFFAGEGKKREGNRTLFVVGDRKQSIFSFQGADAALFEQVRANTARRIKSSKQQYRDEKLLISYRSVQDVLNVVDAVFPQAALASLGFSTDDTADMHTSSRIGKRGVVEIWPVVQRLEAAEPDPWTAPVDHIDGNAPRKILARLIAGRIKSWIGRRILVARDRVIQADDILIVMQRRSPLFSMIIAELRRADVPVAGADRLTLRDSLAVKDLLALAQFILLPTDDYSLACVLKSPLVEPAFDEDQLFGLAQHRGETSLWHRLCQSEEPYHQSIVVYLQSLFRLAALVDPHRFFATVLATRRTAMATRLGPESIDATDAFVDLALDYATTTSTSLAGFVAWFSSEEIVIKRDMDKPTGDVRIMTVHGAKGLEANIVIMPDATELRRADGKGYFEDDRGLPIVTPGDLTKIPVIETLKENAGRLSQQEELRLLYVAMTRACDELYICGGLSGRSLSDRCWYTVIEKAIASSNLLAEITSEAMPEVEGLALRRIGIAPVSHDAGEPEGDMNPDMIPVWALPSPVQSQVQYEPGTAIYSDDHGTSPGHASLRRGIAVHKLLQALPAWPEGERSALAHRLGRDLGLARIDVEHALHLVTREELAAFFTDQAQGEVTLMVAGGETRRIDRLAVTPEAIYLLDYKTGTGKDTVLDENHPYVQQLGRYASGLFEAYPERQLKAALVWTDSGTVSWINSDLLSRAGDVAYQNRGGALT